MHTNVNTSAKAIRVDNGSATFMLKVNKKQLAQMGRRVLIFTILLLICTLAIIAYSSKSPFFEPLAASAAISSMIAFIASKSNHK
jgi:hypothetical protein